MKNRFYQQKGFSIIEILIVVAIIAGGTLLAIPMFNRLTGENLKQSTKDLGRLIRGTYSRAALSGRTFRIVFEIKKEEGSDVMTSTYWVEASVDEAQGDELVKDEEDTGPKFLDTEEREKAKYRRKSEFSPLSDKSGTRGIFSGDVRISGVWIEGMEERLREGTFYLYFYPMGYTLKAIISLSDNIEGTHVMTLETEPMTGEVRFGYAEMPIQ